MNAQVDRQSHVIALGNNFTVLANMARYLIKEYLLERHQEDYDSRLAAQLEEYLLDSIIYAVLNKVYYKTEILPEEYTTHQIICGMYSLVAHELRPAPSMWDIEEIVRKITDTDEYHYFNQDMELTKEILGHHQYVGRISIKRYRSVVVSLYRRPQNATRY